MKFSAKQRERLIAEARGKTIADLEYFDRVDDLNGASGSHWVMTFTDGSETSFRFMAEIEGDGSWGPMEPETPPAPRDPNCLLCAQAHVWCPGTTDAALDVLDRMLVETFMMGASMAAEGASTHPGDSIAVSVLPKLCPRHHELALRSVVEAQEALDGVEPTS